jgi:exodeoxyribonuclease VIII
MGNGSFAAILSIGAIKFDLGVPIDPSPGLFADTFYARVSLESSLKAGLRIDASTVMWWLHPNMAEAREQLRIGEPLELDEALLGLSQWYGEDDSLPVWGNGATFDNVILSNAYKAVGLERPWGYHSDRCFRTLRALAPQVARPQYGVKHDALSDAIAQALWLQAIVSELKLEVV